MTITFEFKGNKKEVEKYFNSKIYSKGFQEKAQKQMSKQLKTEVDLQQISSEASMCIDFEVKYTLTFVRFGACELPKKPVKKRKRA